MIYKNTKKFKNKLFQSLGEERLPGDEKNPRRTPTLTVKRRKGAILAYVVAILTFVAIVSAFMASSAINNLKFIGIMTGKETVQYVARAATELSRGILMSNTDQNGNEVDSYLSMIKNAVYGFDYVTHNPNSLSFADVPQPSVDQSSGLKKLLPYFEYLQESSGVLESSKAYEQMNPFYYGTLRLDQANKQVYLWPGSETNVRITQENMKNNEKVGPKELYCHYGILRKSSSSSGVVSFDDENGDIVGAFCVSFGIYAPKPLKDAADVHINVIAFTGAHASKDSVGIKDNFWNEHADFKNEIPYVLYRFGQNESVMQPRLLDECNKKLNDLINKCKTQSGGEKLRFSVLRCIVPLDAPDKFVTRVVK